MAYNPSNERKKRQYAEYLKEAQKLSGSTIDIALSAIKRYEAFTGYADFKSFNKGHAIRFKNHLANVMAVRSGEPLSKSTILTTTNALKSFFVWLSAEAGYKSCIRKYDIHYFNISRKDENVAKSDKFKPHATLEQIRKVIFSMPSETDIEKRNRAVIAFFALTGMRNKAVITLRHKHVDLERRLVMQDPKQVDTKFSKRIDTFFFPVGEDIEKVAVDWIKFLREEKSYGNDDPVFPRTRVEQNACEEFEAQGIEPVFWETTEPVRKIFGAAFKNAGLEYFNPHSFRTTLVQLGEKRCGSAEQFKAWSQNMGHKHVHTTFTSYGKIDVNKQGEIVKGLTKDNTNTAETLRSVLRQELKHLMIAEPGFKLLTTEDETPPDVVG